MLTRSSCGIGGLARKTPIDPNAVLIAKTRVSKQTNKQNKKIPLHRDGQKKTYSLACNKVGAVTVDVVVEKEEVFLSHVVFGSQLEARRARRGVALRACWRGLFEAQAVGLGVVGAVEARVGAVEARIGAVEARIGAVEAMVSTVDATAGTVGAMGVVSAVEGRDVVGACSVGGKPHSLAR
jgi:hypothetical protein